MSFLIDSYKGEKPVVKLVGMDGNAFSIIGRVSSAWKRLRRPDIADEFRTRATSGDYNNVLMMAMTYAEDEQEDEYEDEDDDEGGDDWNDAGDAGSDEDESDQAGGWGRNE